MVRLARECTYPYASVKVETARRRMRCGVCGREIAKDEEYAVLEYRDGPFRRRKAVCIECAREWVRSNILCEARRQITDATRACILSRMRRLMPHLTPEYYRYGVIPGDPGEKRRARRECRRLLDEHGTIIILQYAMVEAARRLGLEPEGVVMEVHPKARILIV